MLATHFKPTASENCIVLGKYGVVAPTLVNAAGNFAFNNQHSKDFNGNYKCNRTQATPVRCITSDTSWMLVQGLFNRKYS